MPFLPVTALGVIKLKMIEERRIQLHERITKIALIMFAVSCVLALIYSFTYGDYGLSIITAFIIYPSLIVLLGNIAVSDFWSLYQLVRANHSISHILVPLAFCLGRGGCFVYGVYIFLKLEMGVLQSVL